MIIKISISQFLEIIRDLFDNYFNTFLNKFELF